MRRSRVQRQLLAAPVRTVPQISLLEFLTPIALPEDFVNLTPKQQVNVLVYLENFQKCPIELWIPKVFGILIVFWNPIMNTQGVGNTYGVVKAFCKDIDCWATRGVSPRGQLWHRWCRSGSLAQIWIGNQLGRLALFQNKADHTLVAASASTHCCVWSQRPMDLFWIPITFEYLLCVWIPTMNYYEFVLEAGWWPWKSGRGQWACALRSWDRWLRMPAPKPLEIVLRCQLWCWYCFLSYAAGWRSAGTQTRRISLAWAFTCVWGHILTLVDWRNSSWSAGGCW